MRYIGIINKKLFEKISNKIITNEVVLTEKQREHINDRHPGVLKKYERYFSEIIEKPDYILKDKTKDNTALIIKTVEEKNRRGVIIGTVNLVLRLSVQGDNISNKNSIITCIPIGKNRLKSYINNGKIIYKNE